MKPMLAATLKSLADVKEPVLLSPKLDGVRCLVIDGVAYSRNLKPIRNGHVQRQLRHFNNLDGELVVGPPNGPLVLNTTVRGVMSAEGKPDFRLYVFDKLQSIGPFMRRLHEVTALTFGHPGVLAPVPHNLVEPARLELHEQRWLKQGYEGVMGRDPFGPYKHGRATEREGWLWKFKRFTDGEALVTGIEEGSVNTNAATKDELGRTKRSTAKAGKVASGLVGTVLATDCKTGKALRIAPGTMTHDERARYFKSPSLIVGHKCHYRVFTYGAVDADRFPQWHGLRDDV